MPLDRAAAGDRRMGKLRKIGPKGNSPSVTIPKEFLHELGLWNGDRVDLELRNGSIVIRPVNIDVPEQGAE